jgi:hypothetical protein
MHCRWGICILTLGLLAHTAGYTCASEQAELRERVQNMIREAKELAEQGRMEEAKRVKMEASELMQKIERGGRGDRPGEPRSDLDHAIAKQEQLVKDLRAKLERLQQQDVSPEDRGAVKEHLMGVERELDELRAERKRRMKEGRGEERRGEERRGGEGPRGPEGDHERMLAKVRERLEHLGAAAEHLERAGMPDMADSIRRRAGEMKREMEERLRHAREQGEHRGPHGPEGSAEIRELRELVKRLQDENRELRERAERPR